MVRIHQGALTVISTVFSDLLGAVFIGTQRLCAELCADLTQAKLNGERHQDFRAHK